MATTSLPAWCACPSASGRGVGELFGGPLLGALFRHGSDFAGRTVIQDWTIPVDGDGFIKIRNLQQEIAANGFLGFGERTVGHGAPLLAGYDLALMLEGLAGFDFPLLGQSLEPGHEFAGHQQDVLRWWYVVRMCAP